MTFDINPVPKGRPRTTKAGHVYTPAATRAFEAAICVMTRQQWRGPLFTGAVSFRAVFYLKRPKSSRRKYPSVKPDWDNLGKSVSDGIEKAGCVFVNDSQICRSDVSKVYSERPRIEVTISEMD